MALLAHAHLSLAELKAYLLHQGTNAALDVLLTQAINSATAICEQRAGQRQLVSRGDNLITEYFSPLPNMAELQMGDWPVVAVAGGTVHESTDTPRVYDATTLLVAGTDYVIGRTGVLRRLSSGVGARSCVWPYGHRTVKVVYTAGYRRSDGQPAAAEVLPEDLRQVALFVAASIYREADRKGWGVSSMSDPSGNVTRFMGYLPPSMESIIGAHRRYEFDDIRERA